ncbi:MAG: ATP-binding cassette domain-containing protein [Alphaproteobacteria bacterium]|nr:ATP-binding cassette domain-containing protein [Alphaproteobacteria bacterium]
MITSPIANPPRDRASGRPAIKATGLHKVYKLYDDPVADPIKELLDFRHRRKRHREFVAVHPVDFEIAHGEVVGLIGPNGSGKTTLLKMIAGLLQPTSGTIEVDGRVSTLLAMGLGISQDFSGRENILFSGMLYGMSKHEVLAKMEWIVEFAEIGEFIDQPFRTYSSGMKARLLFSIALAVDPDVLIIDEALATGDAHFVQKCMRRIVEICNSGATVLFVSHSLRQVEDLCSRCYLIDHGRIVAAGPPSDVIDTYNLLVFDKEKKISLESDGGDLTMTAGTGEVSVSAIRLLDESGAQSSGFFSLGPMAVEIDYVDRAGGRHDASLFVGFIHSHNDTYVGLYKSEIFSPPEAQTITLGTSGTLRVVFDPLCLSTGDYSLWIAIHNRTQTFCEYKKVKKFFVSRRDHAAQDRAGYFLQTGHLEHIG